VAVIVVTRLRLKDPGVLNDFFNGAAASLEQAQKSSGNLGADALAEAHDTWWTVTSWQDRGTMEAFVAAEPHHSVMARLNDWCDEAAFADWEQPDSALPDWQTSYRHLIADGTVAQLTQASPANQARDYPPPVVPAK
jgi:hypothetical protein